ncbi:phage tail tape measure protein [Microbacterium aquimaris]
MANRTIAVKLVAQVQEYERNMLSAAKATATMGTESERLARYKEAFNAVGRAGVGMGALIGAGVTVAVKKFADFDEAMSNVQAATHETAGNMDLLRQAALDAGASTVYSATEAAGAIEELSKAGVSTADILSGGLMASLNLAAAGELEVAEAAGIAATALKTFGLQGEDMAHVADLLAAGAGKAMGDVSDLASALAQGGQVAEATGLSIEETTAALSAFAAQGLLGSDAGTAFKSMLQRLTPQSAEAERTMKELGIAAYDASGEFVGLSEFAGNLQGALQDLTPEQRNAALATIFGSDAVRAATVLYREGAEGIDEWTAAVDDQGYASETAAARLDNLKGDIEALGGALDTALIETGSAANDTLREMVQALTGLVDMYNDLPGPVKDVVLATGGVAASVGLAGGAALLATTKFIEMRSALAASQVSMKGVTLTAGAAGLALGGLFAIIGEVARKQAEARAKAQSYADALGSGEDAVRELVEANLQLDKTLAFLDFGSAYDNADKLGISLGLVEDAVTEGGAALDELTEILDVATGGGEAAQEMADKLGISYLDLTQTAGTLTEQVNDEREAQERANVIRDQAARATDENAESAESAAEAYLEATEGVQDLRGQLEELIETINEANGVGQDAISQNIAYKDALAEVDAAIAEGTTGWDVNTEAGRVNQQMLVDLAAQSQDAAKAQFDLDGNTDAYRQTLENGRQALIDRAIDLGANADEAEALADQIYRIPDSTEWEVIAETQNATSQIAQFIADSSAKDITIGVTTYRKDAAGDLSFQIGNGPEGRAFGGAIYGPGTGTSDEAGLYRLSNGEHVLTADDVQDMGGQGAVYEFRRALQSGWKPPQDTRDNTTWVPTYGAGSGAAPQPASAPFPDTVTLVDADGSILTRARVVADQQIASHDSAAQRRARGGKAR